MDAIQNGRELLRLASSSQNRHRDSLIRVRQANRIIHVDSRPCTAEELAAHSSLFTLPAGDQNRWMYSRIQAPNISEDFSARQAQPSAVPRILLTPGVSEFWKKPMQRLVLLKDDVLELAFIAIVQGSGGNAVKKVIVANEYPQIATSIFNEAINGFSVVFTGACLKRELEQAKGYGLDSLAVIWRKVTSLDGMFDMRTRAKARKGGEDLIVGILC
jgi:hypothetical protein